MLLAKVERIQISLRQAARVVESKGCSVHAVFHGARQSACLYMQTGWSDWWCAHCSDNIGLGGALHGKVAGG